VGAFLLRFILICVGREDYSLFFGFGYAVCPKILLSCTEKLFYPEERSRLMKKMVAVIHLRLFSTIQESRKQRKIKT